MNVNPPYFDILSETAVRRILGISGQVPLTASDMARTLRVTFFPYCRVNDRIRRFRERLQSALKSCGATVVDYEDALTGDGSRKLQEGIVVIAAGDVETGNLPVDHAANLRTTTFVGIADGPCPVDLETALQSKLDAIVRTLAWNIYQVLMFVEDDAWTITTMNGAIIKCSADGAFVADVAETLIPKLAAPVVPPHASDFEIREGALDLTSPHYAKYVRDFTESGPLWAATGLMLYHTSLDLLKFRNRYYKRIAAAYLDHRSGMSYGFLARQLATSVTSAFTPEEFKHRFGSLHLNGEGFLFVDGRTFVPVALNGSKMVAEISDVRILTTRSGCDKSHLNPHRDLVLMGIANGSIYMETPKGLSTRIDCKPSYDTTTIIAHAVSNSLITGVLMKLRPGSPFARQFQEAGVALAHWHGDVDPIAIPPGYFVHGHDNSPVSCSTHQAAMYALTGKLRALRQSLDSHVDFIGDVHIEPHHGTNITGPTLTELARWALAHAESITGSQAEDGGPVEVASATG